MAERLLGSLAKGTYKATVEPAKQAVEQAIDPKIMRSVFSAGLIGPLIRSIVSEYDKKDEGGQKDKPQVISSDLSRGLEAMSSQLSTLASIMDDIRELTKSQLLTDKDQFNKTLRQTQKADLQAIEDKLEGKKPSVSSLVDSTKKDDKNRLGIVSSLFDFVKNNPILSALLGAGLLASSKTIQKFFEGLSEGALPGMVSEGFQSFKDNLSVGVGSILENLGLSVGTEVSKIITSGLISGLVSKLILRRFGLGFLVGTGIEGVNQIKGSENQEGNQEGNQNKSEASPFEDIASTLGIVLATAMAGSAIKGGKKIFDIGKGMFGSKAPAIAGAGATAAAGAAVGPPMAGTAASVANDKKLTPLERSKLYASRQTTVPGTSTTKLSAMLSKAIKKVSLAAVIAFFKARLGVAALSMLVGGPIGFLLVLVQLGPPAFDLLQEFLDSSDNLDDVDRATGGDRGLDVSPEGVPTMRNVISVGPDGVPTSVPSPLSSLGPASVPYSKGITWNQLSEEQKQALLKSQSISEGYGKPGTLPTDLNNPGALTYRPWMKEFGATQNMERGTAENKGKFAQFPTPEAGFAAQRELWQRMYGNTPIDEALRKWVAPVGADREAQFKSYESKIFTAIGQPRPQSGEIKGQPTGPAANNMTPEKNPLMNVGIIGELSRFYEMATGQPLVINNNQSSSVVGGGGGGDNRPGAQPVHAPNSGEQDRLRDMYGYPRGMLA